MNQQRIGMFLRELRKEKGVTQQQVAEYFRVATRTVSRWETGYNMPDLSLLIEIAEYYDVEVVEILDGGRKGEKMNNEMNSTLQKVADYNETINLKSMRTGVITMIAVFAVLMVICLCKEMNFTPLLSMLCAYNAATFISRAVRTKNRLDMAAGIVLVAAALLSTAALVLG